MEQYSFCGFFFYLAESKTSWRTNLDNGGSPFFGFNNDFTVGKREKDRQWCELTSLEQIKTTEKPKFIGCK